MTDLMRLICDYLLESHYREFLPREYYWHLTRLAESQESTLLESLTDSQRDLLDQYQATQNALHGHELEAMFQVSWKASRELS